MIRFPRRRGSVGAAVAVAIAVAALTYIWVAVAHGGPFHRLHLGNPAPAAVEAAGVETNADASAIAEVQIVMPAQADLPVAAAAEKRPFLLPWNCPNCPGGKCHPKEPVNVNVTVAPSPPRPVAPSPEPDPPRFPWGLLCGVLVPVTLVAGGVAFALRMRSAEAADPE